MSGADQAPEEQARLLARFGRRFAAGEVLFRDGDPATGAFLLHEGRVRLVKRVGASERSLRVLRPGELFGETALDPGSRRTATAVALTEGAALVLEPSTFQALLGGHPAVGARFLQQLLRRLREAEDQIEVLMVRDIAAKVVVALIKLGQAASLERGGPVQLALSPMELSARVGLDVETVKRTVQNLRDQGYVRITDEQVELPDLEALRELYGLLGVRQRLTSPDARP